MRHNHRTTWVVNITTIAAAGLFASRLLWQILMPNVSQIAKTVTVKIDGANTGSGVIIEQQGNRYIVLSNWHVVSGNDSLSEGLLLRQTLRYRQRSTKSFKIQTVDRRKHLVTAARLSELVS